MFVRLAHLATFATRSGRLNITHYNAFLPLFVSLGTLGPFLASFIAVRYETGALALTEPHSATKEALGLGKPVDCAYAHSHRFRGSSVLDLCRTWAQTAFPIVPPAIAANLAEHPRWTT